MHFYELYANYFCYNYSHATSKTVATSNYWPSAGRDRHNCVFVSSKFTVIRPDLSTSWALVKRRRPSM